MKEIELCCMIFLVGLISIYTTDNSSAQSSSINTTDNSSAQSSSINTVQKQDYIKQFAEFSQLIIIPNSLIQSQSYEVYGQIKNFLTGEAISNTTISFRIFPPNLDFSTPFNTTKTDPNGNFKMQFLAPKYPSFYYLSAYLTGNKDYYPTDSEPVPFVVFK